MTNLAINLRSLGKADDAYDVDSRAATALAAALPDMTVWWRQAEDVVRATQTIAIAQRKAGQYATALTAATANYRDCQNRFGPDHELTLAAMMTDANTMRTIGDAIGAQPRHRDAAPIPPDLRPAQRARPTHWLSRP